MSDVASSAALPILTFGETTLSPSMGYVFDPRWLDPCESLVSMLWKFTAMNGLGGHSVASQIAKRPVDPYEGFAATAAEVDIRGVARALGVPLKVVRTAVYRPGLFRGWCSKLRFCPRCMARGYHGVVHQIGCEPQCPVHGLWLETECPGCGATTDYRIDVRLLDAPFRCAHCRRSYAPTRTSFVSRPPLSKRARSSIVRMFIGVGNAPGRPLHQRAER